MKQGKIGDLSSINRNQTKYNKFQGSQPVKSQWVLHSGKTVDFFEEKIDFETLRDKTFVNFAVNGRNQKLLTDESLKRLSSLDNQQYYPAIGYKHDDGRIEILDGSSRRAYVLRKGGEIPTFRVMYCVGELSLKDARELAKELRTSLELHLYEIGEIAEEMFNKEMPQQEIAEILGYSQRKISYAIRTRAIPESVMKCFPVINELTWSDYKELIKLVPLLPKKIALESEFISVSDTIKALTKLTTEQGVVAKEKPVNKTIREPLLSFPSKTRSKALKITSSENNNVAYKFERLGAEANAIIEEKMKEAMELIKENSETTK